MKLKRIFSFVMAATLLIMALAIPAQAEDKPNWIYRYTLWVADVNDAGAPESSVYGYMVFRDDYKKEQSFAGAGIKRGAKVTKEIETGYAPWTVKKVGIINKSTNALCVENIMLEVKKEGQKDWEYITLLDKYNPKSNNMKWIETEKGSGYDKKFEKSISWDTKREISSIGNFNGQFSGNYTLDVTKEYSNKITKIWNKQITDQYLTKYNSKNFSDTPTISYNFSVTSLDSTLVANRNLFDKNGFSESDDGDGYTLDMAKILSLMNKKTINKITITATLEIPVSSLDTYYSSYENLGGKDNGKFSSTYTITRNAFAISDLTYSDAVTGMENTKDNYYYSNANPMVTVSGKVKTGGNNNHISLNDIKGKEVSFTSAKIQLGADKTALVSASSTTAVIDNNGRFTLKFPLNARIDSKNVGLTLILEGGKINIKNGLWLCEETEYFEPGNMSSYASSYKVDTITPTITLTPVDEVVENGWRKKITLASTASEDIYSNSEKCIYEYEFKSEDGAISISDKNGVGNFDLSQVAPAADGQSTVVTVSLKEKVEAIGDFVVSGKDIAGNPVTTTYNDIKLDNLYPRVEMEAKENARASDGSKSIEYSFNIEDASGTGRAYYCFTEGLSNAPVFDESSIQHNSGILNTTVGMWAYVQQGTNAVALLKCENGKSFIGRLHYFTKDDLGNTSGIQSFDITLLNENTSCDITATDENTKIPLKDYNINITTAQGNKVFWRWSHPDKEGYIADFRSYSSDIGNGKQTDDSGNEITLDGACTLEVKVVTPSNIENTVSRQFIFDNSKPEISFTAKNTGTFRDVQVISVKATDASDITAASAVILNVDGSRVKDTQEIPINITDGIAAENISLTGLKSGAYCLKVTATDGNGYVGEETSNPFYIRSSAPDLFLDIQSERTYEELPLLSNKSYTLKLNVNEAFDNPTTSIKQTLYYRISENGNEYGAWIAVGAMEESGDAYSLAADIDTPISLSEGENKIFVQTVIAAGDANPDYLGEKIIATKAIGLYFDETAPKYTLSLDDIHTKNAILGKISLSDNLSDQITLTSESENVKITETVEKNIFNLEVLDNVETNLSAVDLAGNETIIPLIITMIDKEAPTAEISSISKIERGERTDVSAEIYIKDVDKETVQLALIPASEASGNSIDDKYFSYSEDAFRYELLYEETAADVDETNATYKVSLAGVTGKYVIGVRSSDSIGNTSDVILRSNPLEPVNAEINKTGFSVSPKKAGKKAVVTVDFNVPVSVLPQSMITDLPTENLSLEETNLNLAGKYIEGFSQKSSFIIEEMGSYKLYAVDELGRGKAFDIDVTDDDVSFNNATQIEVKTVFVRVHPNYETGGSDVVEKTTLDEGSWASAEKTYITDGFDTIVTRVEVTSTEENMFLRDINYKSADENPPTIDGLTFNKEATEELAIPDSEDYTTLVYDISEIVDEKTNKAIDKNERTIEVYTYQQDTAPETWNRNQVIVDTIDNTAPSGEITIDPYPIRDEATGDPLSFTLGNVNAQATFSDPHSGISEISLEVFGGEAEGNYDVLLTEDYSIEPYRITNEYFSMTVWSDTDPKSTKYVEVEFYQNINAMILAKNTAGSYGYCGLADGLNINYINKVDISSADYTLSYYYLDNNDEWKLIEDKDTYYKNAKAVITPTDSGDDRGLYVANNSGKTEKPLNFINRSFDFVLRDKYGYEKTVSAELLHFDETPGTISYELDLLSKTNKSISVKIKASDTESGVDSVTLLHGTEQIMLKDNLDGTYTGAITNSGKHIITLLDKAGNKTEKSFMVSGIDATPPVISNMEYNTKERTSKTVTVKLQFSKPNVTITKVETDGYLGTSDYSVDYGNSTLRFYENGTLSVYFTDDYGNEGKGTVAVSNIYKTPPAVEAVTELAEDMLSVNVSFKKAVDSNNVVIDKKRELKELTVIYGGIANRIENEDGEKAVYSFFENGIYTFKIFDDEGLATYVTLEITGIDSAAPQIKQIRWIYKYDILENGEWKSNTESGYRDIGDESGYVMATDIYPVTNRNVSITAVTDSKTAIIGAEEEFSTEHTLDYNQNGIYIFNLKKANGLSDSYGVDVELIDKTPPVIEVDSPEIVFYENPKANTVQYSKEMLSKAFRAYDMFGGYKDLSGEVSIDYGNFNPDIITENTFDRNIPYTVTYKVSDTAGNTTELKRTVRLVGYFDTIALVNGELPDYAGRKEINTDTIKISLKNFSGISYARIEKGVKTLGQMKKIGEVIPEKTSGSGEYEYTVTENGWYTIMVQTDNRDYFNLQVYVQN